MLLKLLKEAVNGADKAYLVEALGAIGFKPASLEIERLLTSKDWRVTFTAVQSLGWLKSSDSTVALQEIGKTHWLPESRDLA